MKIKCVYPLQVELPSLHNMIGIVLYFLLQEIPKCKLDNVLYTFEK